METRMDWPKEVEMKWNPARCDCGGKIITVIPEIEDRTYSIGYAHACGYRD